MSSNRYLIRMTPPEGAPVPILVQGRPVINWWPELVTELTRRFGPEVPRLFAEPVAPAKLSAGASALSWYTSIQGDAHAFPSLDEAGQRVVSARLRDMLLTLRPLLADPAFGAKLAGALIVPSLEDVLVVSGQPILVSWGHMAAGRPRDGMALETHFLATLGRFAPELAQAADGQDHDTATPTQAAPSDALRPSGGDRTARQADAPELPRSAPQNAEPSAGPGWWPARNTAPPISSRAPFIASSIAALALLVLIIPGVLIYPALTSRSVSVPVRSAALIEHNRELERRLDQLREQLSAPSCPATQTPIRTLLPSSREGPRQRAPAAAPSEPGSTQATPSSPPLPGGASTLASVPDLLDSATVFIVGLSSHDPMGASVTTGSGFLVSDRHVVTNAHVVATAARDAIFIANRTMGQARRGRIVALSWEQAEGPREDLAIIEIEADPSRSFLRVGPMPTRQDEIVAVGFPAFVVSADTRLDLRGIVEGRSEGAPEPQQIRGFVTGTPQVTERGFQVVTHTAQTAPGNSGGPLADLCGRVVGVNTWVRGTQAGPQVMNIAQTASTLVDFLRGHGIAIERDERSCRSDTRRADPIAR
jgi:S1-C subfamily serine protease